MHAVYKQVYNEKTSKISRQFVKFKRLLNFPDLQYPAWPMSCVARALECRVWLTITMGDGGRESKRTPAMSVLHSSTQDPFPFQGLSDI